jgi:hypothetical protein
MDSRAGWVERRKEAGELAVTDLSEIVEQARAKSRRDHDAFVEYAPFEGLVRLKPFRALSALSVELRQGRVPIELWRQLLSDWPEKSPERLTCLCGKRLASLSKEVLFELRFYAPDWVQQNLPSLLPKYVEQFWSIWDSIFEKLVESGPKATESGLGETTVGGQIVERSRKTISHTINGPIGKLVSTLFASLGDRKFQANEGLSRRFSKRLERSLSAPGEGADHAACLVGERLRFLYYVDPGWAKEGILQISSISSPLAEGFWNGLVSHGGVPQSPELFDLIKKDFLAICSDQSDWLKEDSFERDFAQFLIIATFWHKHDERYLTGAECRRALRSLSDSGREAALWTVNNILEEQSAWTSFGKQFFSEVWPQEARYQTGATSASLIRIAENTPDRFSDIVSVIGEYLRPIEHPDLFVFRLRRKEGEGERETLVQRWPLHVLDVVNRIIPKEPQYVPHDLGVLLNEIVEFAPSARTTRGWQRLYGLVSK